MSFRFRIASINALGASHTDSGSAYKKFAVSAVRTLLLVRVIVKRRFSVVGLQEFQGKQQRVFNSKVSLWAMHVIQDNAIVWLRPRWKLVYKGYVTMPYFHGKAKNMPYVVLEARSLRRKGTVKQIAVLAVHNPASVHGDALEWRKEGWGLEADWAHRILRNNPRITAAVSVGDRNSGPDTFKPFIEDLGGKVAGVPEIWGIDWIVGWGHIHFDNFQASETPRISRMTDHPVVQATGVLPL